MSTVEFREAAALIRRALNEGRPDLVFGVEALDQARIYRRLVQIVHPDVNGNSRESTAALIDLMNLWRSVEEGAGARFVEVTTKTRALRVYHRVSRDDVADSFRAYWGPASDQTGLLRVARKPRDNDLIRAEAAALKKFGTNFPFVPKLFETVAVRQSGGVVKQANLLSDSGTGWHTFAEIAADQQIGPLDLAWMWRRLLAAIGYANEAGIVHGAVSERNVLVHPNGHGLILRNWSYQVPVGQPLRAVERGVQYPPEVKERKPATGATDVYLAARAALALTRGALTAGYPRPIRAFFRACLLDHDRPGDAWKLLDDFDDLLERNYGPRRFRPFAMKGGTTSR